MLSFNTMHPVGNYGIFYAEFPDSMPLTIPAYCNMLELL